MAFKGKSVVEKTYLAFLRGNVILWYNGDGCLIKATDDANFKALIRLSFLHPLRPDLFALQTSIVCQEEAQYPATH